MKGLDRINRINRTGIPRILIILPILSNLQHAVPQEAHQPGDLPICPRGGNKKIVKHMSRFAMERWG
jgi:hypothetical protein